MSLSDDAVFQARFDYHKDLTDKRWQYYATLVVFTGFLVGAVGKIMQSEIILQALLSVAAVFTCCAFLRLIIDCQVSNVLYE